MVGSAEFGTLAPADKGKKPKRLVLMEMVTNGVSIIMFRAKDKSI